MTCKKNFVKIIENLLQYFSEKFVGDNLSITDIAIKNWDLSIVGIAQGFFEVIDHRYRFSTERFIVAIFEATHRINTNDIDLKSDVLSNL